MSTDASFGRTLQFITSIKLSELEKQRHAYYQHLNQSLQKADAIANPRGRVQTLLDAVIAWKGSGATNDSDTIGEGTLNLENLRVWLTMCETDPSFDQDQVRHWDELLRAHLKHNSLKFDCAKLFGELFNEWLGSGDSTAATYQGPDESVPEESTTFVDVGRKELHEQKEKLESLIFDEKVIDVDVLKKYLEELFSSKANATALDNMRKTLKRCAKQIQSYTFTPYTLRSTIKSILSSGLMSEDKRATLQAFLDNETVLKEVASVLQMRLASVDTWAWPKEGIMIEMRRHLTGKYRAFMDPDIIDALLLHHLGLVWQVYFRQACQDLYRSGAWKKLSPPFRNVERKRTKNLFKNEDEEASINHHRSTIIDEEFFLTQLASSLQDDVEYDDLVDGQDDEGEKPHSPVAIKRKLLHMMLGESYLNTTIHNSFAVVRSDLEWFGPSLPHNAILTILEFFGIPSFWLTFFKTFLQAPLYFKGENSSNARVRLRGTPISYTLSTIFGEAILFAMDFAVNQKTGGLFLFRMHDDFWLWDSKPERCADGWAEMNKFAEITGLKFNMGKTGSAVVGGGVATGLPPGDIRWGFLQFDASKGRFEIDQKDIDVHVAELRRQLNATKSVFGWVNVFNKYMTFMLRNFGGEPTYAFGHDHVMDVINTLARVQRELFPDSENGAVGHLRKIIKEKWDVDGLPLGYFYFPMEQGGLGLRNPMVEGYAPLSSFSATNATKTPQEKFQSLFNKDHDKYNLARERWNQNVQDKKNETFCTYEEYISYRERLLRDWGTCYEEMFQQRTQYPAKETPSLTAILSTTPSFPRWTSMDLYQKWVISLYGEELVKKFGGFTIVDPTLIPLGMVQLFKDSRIKLDQ